MPFYDFVCENQICSHQFTIKRAYSEDFPIACLFCGSAIRQIYSPVPAHYKGSGFFSTDNKKDTRVRSESGALGRRVSETDVSNIDEETPTRLSEKGRPKMTPTRPLPKQMKARKIVDDLSHDGSRTRRTHIF